MPRFLTTTEPNATDFEAKVTDLNLRASRKRCAELELKLDIYKKHVSMQTRWWGEMKDQNDNLVSQVVSLTDQAEYWRSLALSVYSDKKELEEELAESTNALTCEILSTLFD